MGLLATGGAPMIFGSAEQDKAIPYVKEHGVVQFINVYKKYVDCKDQPFLWGEELEHLVVSFPDKKPNGEAVAFKDRDVKLSLTADPIIQGLKAEQEQRAADALHPTNGDGSQDDTSAAVTDGPVGSRILQVIDGGDHQWLPEYGSFMIETTPKAPYTSGTVGGLLRCEANLAGRYRELRRVLKGTGQTVVTLVTFPRMGTEDFVDHASAADNANADGTAIKKLQVRGEFADSLFIPDECINMTHPRFSNLTRNIRFRRGRKVCIQVPMYIDSLTLSDSVDTKYRIDKHPMNSAIDCAPVEKPKIKSLDDDDDEDEDTAAVEFADAQKTAESAVVNHVAASPSPQDVFSHLFTPATDYYYAQYSAAKEEQRVENVRQRYNACPCPVPSVSHPCVYMDCMAFGMGNSCLQVTMQAADVAQARHIFDQLAVVCPMFLAVSAATPVQKGMLCNSDVRWLTIAASVDCRQREEVPRIIKSRYDSVSLFISPLAKSLEEYNDSPVETNAKVCEKLMAEGFDERLACHVSHLFIRDPLVIFDGRVDTLDDSKETDHFENIQSTNWQTVRFKPPPSGSHSIGWRVEFRVMEVQMTAFENAAFSVIIVLLTKAIIKYNLWLYMPMSKVDQNMGRSHMIHPTTQKYWFRAGDYTKDTSGMKSATDGTKEFTLDELFNGTAGAKAAGATTAAAFAKGEFPGFCNIVRRYIAEERLTDPRFEEYLDLVGGRASGKYQTTADFLRDFVTTHPEYKNDSRVSPAIAHDMCVLADRLAGGEVTFDSLLPKGAIVPVDNGAGKGSPVVVSRVDNSVHLPSSPAGGGEVGQKKRSRSD